MHFTRGFCNSVVLPDGKVGVFGGQVRTHKSTFESSSTLSYMRLQCWRSRLGVVTAKLLAG